MKWVMENYQAALAILGAIYSLALIIVKLTPTPKDDIALQKVSVILKVLAKVFGLDLKQGINRKVSGALDIKDIGTKTKLISIIFVCSIMMSCAIMDIREDSRAEYVLANKTFAATVNSLTALKVKGVFDESEINAIGVLITSGQILLNQWHKDIITDTPIPKDTWGEIGAIINQLTVFEMKGV